MFCELIESNNQDFDNPMNFEAPKYELSPQEDNLLQLSNTAISSPSITNPQLT